MKRISLTFIVIAALLGSCSQKDWNTNISEDEMIEYKLHPGQYAVVVVIDKQTTMTQAQKAARHRAAQLAVSGGYRYFLIQSEVKTRVIKQQAMLENNMEEMMVEGDFGQNQLLASSANHEVVCEALKVVFQCYKEKPKGRAIKVCNWIDCSNLK